MGNGPEDPASPWGSPVTNNQSLLFTRLSAKPPGTFTAVMNFVTSPANRDQTDRVSSGYWINNYFCSNIVKTSTGD